MFTEIVNKWDKILQTMKTEFDITDVSFKTWLLPLKPYSLENLRLLFLNSLIMK